MSTRVRSAALVMFLLLLLFTSTATAQVPDDAGPLSVQGGSATYSFSYQGYIEDGGSPANGTFDFVFWLYDSSAPTATIIDQLNSFVPLTGVVVEDGLFSFYLKPVTKSLEEAFNGGMRWIEVQVRRSGTATYTTLPRQPIAPAPYAWSLQPGSIITGTVYGGSTLTVGNAYDAGTIGSAIYAENHADTSPTIAGRHYGDGPAIYGYAEGVYPAVEGMRYDDGVAVGGYTSGGIGVIGSASTNAGIGVVGAQTGYGANDASTYYIPGGYFGGRNGVIGVTKDGSGYGVFGYNLAASNGWAGSFTAYHGRGVRISTPAGQVGLTVIGGTKNAVVGTKDGSRLLYTEESTEVWFTDYGFGTLVDGVAAIPIDAVFAQTVNLDEPYHVFVEPYGEAALYVTDRTPEGFVVHAHEGDPDVEFSYRIVGKRLGYEDARLERAPWADDDPALHPEKAGLQQQGGTP